MWGATREAPTPPMLTSLSRIAKQNKNSYLHDMNFLNEFLWPIMQKAGVRQHDAFSCDRYAALGTSTGWPYKRGGGEHVGAVYLNSDVSRPGDIALLPQNDTCTSPEYEAGFRDESLVETLGPCEYDTKLCQVELRYVFVDGLAHCRNKTLSLPVIFNFTNFFLWPISRYKCPLPVSANVSQYYDRIQHNQTHFDVFKPRGIQFIQSLHLSDSLYCSSEHFCVAEALPVFMYILSNMSEHSKLMLPDGNSTAYILNAALQAQASFRARPLHAENWQAQPWAAAHLPAPSLWWAFRAVLHTSTGPQLSDLPRHGINFLDLATRGQGVADHVFATGATYLATTNKMFTYACIVAVAGESAMNMLTDKVNSTWELRLLEEHDGPAKWANILTSARAVVVDSTRPPIYMGLVRPQAAVLLLNGDKRTFPRFCAVKGGVQCLYTQQRLEHALNKDSC